MTFDQWIDAVNDQVRAQLGPAVRTEELSWDSAMWVGSGGSVVAALADDETTATISFEAGDRMSVPFAQTAPDGLGSTIAGRLVARSG